ncbi:hypothetical protein O988_01911 [Pseudogymnoascus sp. VKM F-3808]|nr:hypothetical protein O988_01911 [Pseudogymnoascus sp. VKM F-3808]
MPNPKSPDHVWGRDLQHASFAESRCTARMAVEGAIVSGRVTVAAQGTGCRGFGPYHLTRIVMGLSTMAISRLSSAIKKPLQRPIYGSLIPNPVRNTPNLPAPIMHFTSAALLLLLVPVTRAAAIPNQGDLSGAGDALLNKGDLANALGNDVLKGAHLDGPATARRDEVGDPLGSVGGTVNSIQKLASEQIGDITEGNMEGLYEFLGFLADYTNLRGKDRSEALDKFFVCTQKLGGDYIRSPQLWFLSTLFGTIPDIPQIVKNFRKLLELLRNQNADPKATITGTMLCVMAALPENKLVKLLLDLADELVDPLAYEVVESIPTQTITEGGLATTELPVDSAAGAVSNIAQRENKLNSGNVGDETGKVFEILFAGYFDDVDS